MARHTVPPNKIKKLRNIRCCDEDWSRIQELADQCGLTTSEYLRRAGQNRKLHASSITKEMRELNRLGGLQKLCIMREPGERPGLNNIIRLITSVMKKLDESVA